MLDRAFEGQQVSTKVDDLAPSAIPSPGPAFPEQYGARLINIADQD